MSTPGPREQIRISSAATDTPKPAIAQAVIARRWRFPVAGLTFAGGVLALECAILPLVMPRLMHSLFMDQFWNTSFNVPKGQFLGSFVSIMLWDEDNGFILSYFIGIALALMLFTVLANLLDFCGIMIFRENE